MSISGSLLLKIHEGFLLYNSDVLAVAVAYAMAVAVATAVAVVFTVAMPGDTAFDGLSCKLQTDTASNGFSPKGATAINGFRILKDSEGF